MVSIVKIWQWEEPMRKLLTLLAATVAFSSLLPSVSQATCTAIGTIPRIFVQSAITNVGVRANGGATTFFNFTTSASVFIDASLVSEASHITVQINGNASSCGPVIGGVSQGGTITAILVSP